MTIQQIQATTEYMDVIDVQGKPHHIILMTVPQSMRSYKLVKEFGDGVDRMVYATIRQHKDEN